MARLYKRLSIHQEFHAGAFAILVETQDVGTCAEVFGVDLNLVRTFGEATHVLVHHHTAGEVEHLIADIGVSLDVEAHGSLALNRIRIHGDVDALGHCG